jgi:holo-[acyl-carrier protein] synthase
MKIVGIGTDIVSIARIQSIWDRFGSAFARRILATSELERLSLSRDPVPFLAKRYAAKEAVSKALGTGFRPQGILLTEIGVNNDALGRPYLEFSGSAGREMMRLNIIESHLSLSDEKEFALAFVVLVAN